MSQTVWIGFASINYHYPTTPILLHFFVYRVDAKVPADFFSFQYFKTLSKQNIINQ